MDTNYKGDLIEWCVKNDIDWHFELVEEYGPAHNKKFRYCVIVNGIRYESPQCPSKKIAQHEAAKLYLQSDDISQCISAPFAIESGRFYYIDLENCADINLSFFDNNCKTIASIGASKAILNRANIVTSCTRSDAADVALIVKITEDIVKNEHEKYGIVSRDKLLLTSVEVLKDIYGIDIEAVIL